MQRGANHLSRMLRKEFCIGGRLKNHLLRTLPIPIRLLYPDQAKMKIESALKPVQENLNQSHLDER